MQIDHEGANENNENWVKWVMNGSHDQLLEFCDPSISRERLMLDNSNLAGRSSRSVLTKKMKI